MPLTDRNRPRRAPPPSPAQQSMFDREFNGELRLMHELYLRGQRAEFINGLTTPESRRRVAREQLAGVADQVSLSVREKTVGQLFEQTYREPLNLQPTGEKSTC